MTAGRSHRMEQTAGGLTASFLSTVLAGFAGLRVVVLGDAVLDTYLDGEPSRLSREAPVPVVDLRRATDVPGAAGNAARNASGLGAEVRLVSLVGDDGPGALLRRTLDAAGVDTSGMVVERGRRTVRLQRIRAAGQLLVRLDEGDDDGPPAGIERRLAAAARHALDGADLLVVSDYGKGTLSPTVRREATAAARRAGVPVVVDAKHLAAYRGLGVTAVKPNWSEAVALLGGWAADEARVEGIARHGDRILELSGARIAAVTLDDEGAVVFERGLPPHRTSTRPRPHAMAIGAGDTFSVTFALALAAGGSSAAAAELAARAADVILADPDTGVCSLLGLVRRLAEESKLTVTVDELGARVDAERAAGRRIVFTNGCFDVLHSGHLAFLQRARALGDVLIVAVNGDRSVSRLRGPGRPVVPLHERLALVGALSAVDHVIAFEEDTPSALLASLRPDIVAKGDDYTWDTLPEAPLLASLGIETVFLGPEPDAATAHLLGRVAGAPVSAAPPLRSS